MEIGTKVFRRIVLEAKGYMKTAAVDTIADTMQETYRFGCYSRSYIEGCAKNRLEEKLSSMRI